MLSRKPTPEGVERVFDKGDKLVENGIPRSHTFGGSDNPPIIEDGDREYKEKRDALIKSLDVEHDIPADVDEGIDLDHAPSKKSYPNELHYVNKDGKVGKVGGKIPPHAAQGEDPMIVPVLPNQRPYKGEIFPIFETPMFKGVVDGIDRDEVIKDVRELTKVVAETHPRADECYTTYFSKKARALMYEMQWFKDFEMNIKQTYREYMEHVWDDYIHDNEHVHLFAWVNRYRGRNSHNYHIHNGSAISGTWYIKADEGNDMPIKFVNPQSQMAMKMNELEYRDDNIKFDQPELGSNKICKLGSQGFTHELHFHPTCMDYLLWPSWLYHGVEGQSEEGYTDNYERISLSFNLAHHNPRPINESDKPFEQLMKEHQEEIEEKKNKS